MRPSFCLFLLALIALPAGAQSPSPVDSAAAVDSVFVSWTGSASPGCAVGVSRDGKPILTRAYGMANLEYDVPNRSTTIFEAGSVSKQFTAAAVVLLALEGKLALEDPIRKYFPELPSYADSVTIRQMLTHTSGLRDWGAVVAAAGWPRGTRTYTHTHVLDVMSRQQALNFSPGSEYLYSNSNYNLAAMLVERVSGQTLSEFTRTRLFQPLGMTNTSWRDDYSRIVKNRSTAYSGSANAGWRQDMPFENVYGNSSLLTTVEDLLKWNQNFANPTVGGRRLVEAMHTRGRLTNGRTIPYALGIVVDEFRGIPEVNHTGATAGYRAYLARFPEQQLGVALLCNSGSANPGILGRQVAAVFLRGHLRPLPSQAAAAVRLSPAVLQARAGLYRQLRTGAPLRLTVRDSALRWGAALLTPLSETSFVLRPSNRVEFSRDGRTLRMIDLEGDTLVYAREMEWAPAAAELAQYGGTYTSDEAETWFTVSVKDGHLVVADRYGRAQPLTPAYRDAFTRPGGSLVVFRRSASGAVTAASLGLGRVRDLRFDRTARR